MRLFITGISGFLGVHLARLALGRGDVVAGIHLGQPPPDELAAAEVAEVDLLDFDALATAVERAAPQAVVHLAGLSHVGRSWRRVADYYRANVTGTENLLGAVAERAPGARVLVASSAEVYGRVPEAEQPIPEARPLAPPSPYALTKAAAERLALARWAAGGPPVTLVRTFNLVGPGQLPRFALPAFAEQLAAILRGEQEPVLAVGNLAARRDFVHVADGAAAYRLLAERGEPGGTYNLASGRAFSIAEALERLIAVSGQEVRVEEDPERLRPVDLPLLAGDAARLRALGWEAERTLDDAVRDLWASVL